MSQHPSNQKRIDSLEFYRLRMRPNILSDLSCESFHARPHTVPKSIEEQLRKEVDRLAEIRVLEEDYTS
jgi:hypothetical protein